MYSIKLVEGGNMVDHITKIYQTRDKLNATGQNIIDQYLAALLLCSLQLSHETLITALDFNILKGITLNFIQNKLIDAFSKRIENNGDNASNQSTLKVKFQKEKVNKFCRYCKKNSHNIE